MLQFSHFKARQIILSYKLMFTKRSDKNLVLPFLITAFDKVIFYPILVNWIPVLWKSWLGYSEIIIRLGIFWRCIWLFHFSTFVPWHWVYFVLRLCAKPGDESPGGQWNRGFWPGGYQEAWYHQTRSGLDSEAGIWIL